jgi:hypothetical protein
MLVAQNRPWSRILDGWASSHPVEHIGPDPAPCSRFVDISNLVISLRMASIHMNLMRSGGHKEKGLPSTLDDGREALYEPSNLRPSA